MQIYSLENILESSSNYCNAKSKFVMRISLSLMKDLFGGLRDNAAMTA